MAVVATTTQPGSRRLPPFNLITGLVGMGVGFVIGLFIGKAVAGGFDYVQATDQNDLALVLGYICSVIGFLGGMGFLNYPIARVLGRPIKELDYGSGFRRYFTMCPDHKVVGVQYMWGALFFFLVGGLDAMFIRAQLLRHDNSLFTQGQYITLVGLHGSTMILIMSAGLLGPFANYLVPLMIGARKMALPRIEALGFWLVPPAGIILTSAIFVGGFSTGWTGYQPLADQTQMGEDAYLIAFVLFSLAIVLVGLNLMATIITMRAPGMGWTRLPIFVWGVIGTSLLMVLSAPVLTAVVIMSLMDRTVGTTFFVPVTGGSAFLWENLWWFFGHPEVYILALPGFGIVMEILPVFARKQLWGYKLGVAGILGVALLSFMVWQHHLFVNGINADLRPFYMLTTELISIPTGFVFLNAMGTLWKAKIRFSAPMLFSLAFFFNFLIGGISGVYASDAPSDVTTHGSFFIMAHFHYTIMGGLVFAMFAAIYYWGPKMTGYKFSETLAKWHFWLMFIFFNSTFLPLFAVGFLGMPRRVPTYPFYLQTLNDWVSISAFLLGGSMLIFMYNFVRSLVFDRKPAERNPWDSRGLEWQLPTPVPTENFARVPRIMTTPYEYGVPNPQPVAIFEPVASVAPQEG